MWTAKAFNIGHPWAEAIPIGLIASRAGGRGGDGMSASIVLLIGGRCMVSQGGDGMEMLKVFGIG